VKFFISEREKVALIKSRSEPMNEIEQNKCIQNVVSIPDVYNGETKTHVLKHFGKMIPIDEIDASQFDLNNFVANNLKKNKPLLIRNYLMNFDCGTAFKNWNLDYLGKLIQRIFC
jgi:hypothetical protein